MKKYKTTTIILLILLLLRLIGQTFPLSVHSLWAILYLLAIIGIIRKEKWGYVVTIIIAILDIIFSVMLVSATGDLAFGIGAVTIDVLLLYLAAKDYKQIN